MGRFVTVKMFAEMLGISERFAWTLVWSGQVPAVRVGRRTVRVPLEEALAAFPPATQRGPAR